METLSIAHSRLLIKECRANDALHDDVWINVRRRPSILQVPAAILGH